MRPWKFHACEFHLPSAWGLLQLLFLSKYELSEHQTTEKLRIYDVHEIYIKITRDDEDEDEDTPSHV